MFVGGSLLNLVLGACGNKNSSLYADVEKSEVCMQVRVVGADDEF